jgi:hypothetical protein
MATPTELEKPAGAQAPSANEPVIHVIPEKFYGAALKKKVGPMPPVQSGVTPPPPTGPVPPTPPKKKKPVLLIVIIAVVLLGGGGAAAFFLLPKKKAPAPVAVNTAPPPPVCGDKKCDAPQETAASCSADCGPPPPVCGDDKCEEPKESPQNCSADCGPPPPVCGDNKCEAPSETLESCAADCKPPEPTPGLDSESDGLTDLEEQEVFGTKIDDPNTDKDVYVDLNEALNLYDPATPAPSALKDNPKVATYSSTALGFTILRPATWNVREGTAEAKEVFFGAPSGEFIQVLMEEKAPGQSLMEWFLAQSPGVTSSQVELYKTRQGYDAILSPDRFTAYVAFNGDKVAVVSYNLGKQLQIQYKITFQMMIMSLMSL